MEMSNMIPVFVILFACLLLNIPIYLSLLAGAIYMTVIINHMPMQNIVSGMFEGVTKTSLLAIPFFILAGSALSGGTLGDRIVGIFRGLFSGRASGMAMACLGANAIFGAISGSPPAATATFGKILYTPLKDTYDENLSTGVIVCAASLSSIIPPSTPLIIYGIVAETSVAKLFIGGILPGLIIIGAIATYLLFAVRKFHVNIQKMNQQEKLTMLQQGLPVMLLPVLVLGGIYGGFVTPVEAGAFAAVYAIVVSTVVLREMTWKKLVAIMRDAASTSVQVMVLVSTSSVFAQQLMITQMPVELTKSFSQMSTIAFLLMIALLFLIVGCFIDSISAILIFVPLLLPAAIVHGIDPIHFGVAIIVNLSMGMFTPPFGLNLFVAQGVFGRDIWSISRSVIPYVGVYLIGLLLTVYVPAVSMTLPSLM
jgi:C4-dicarboxylate transporter DctM subunit